MEKNGAGKGVPYDGILHEGIRLLKDWKMFKNYDYQSGIKNVCGLVAQRGSISLVPASQSVPGRSVCSQELTEYIRGNDKKKT